MCSLFFRLPGTQTLWLLRLRLPAFAPPLPIYSASHLFPVQEGRYVVLFAQHFLNVSPRSLRPTNATSMFHHFHRATRTDVARGTETVQASLHLIREQLTEIFKLFLRGNDNRQRTLDYLAKLCNVNARRALLGSRTESQRLVRDRPLVVAPRLSSLFLLT